MNLIKLIGKIFNVVNESKGHGHGHSSGHGYGHSSGHGKSSLALKLLTKFLGKK